MQIGALNRKIKPGLVKLDNTEDKENKRKGKLIAHERKIVNSYFC